LQLNKLNDLYKEKGLVIIGAPCNQFGHQENGSPAEILAILKHVRPGNGFVPNFPLLEKADVNGHKTQPLYKFLRISFPYQEDRHHAEEIEQGPSEAIWAPLFSPITHTDVKWNFEKFLIDKQGKVRHRFTNKEPIEMKEEIEKLLAE